MKSNGLVKKMLAILLCGALTVSSTVTYASDMRQVSENVADQAAENEEGYDVEEPSPEEETIEYEQSESEQAYDSQEEENDDQEENYPEEEDVPAVHEHVYEYTDLGDGTHNITCKGIYDENNEDYTECGFEAVKEAHTYDENGVCICGAVDETVITEEDLKEQVISKTVDGYKITASGLIPEGAELFVEKIEYTERAEELINDENSDITFIVYDAFDIKIMVGEKEYQPMDFGEKVKISVTGLDLDESENEGIEVHRISDNGQEVDALISEVTDEGTVEFETEHFTTFTISGKTYTVSDDWYENYSYSIDLDNQRICLNYYGYDNIGNKLDVPVDVVVPATAVIAGTTYHTFMYVGTYRDKSDGERHRSPFDGNAEIKSIVFEEGAMVESSTAGGFLSGLLSYCTNLESANLNGLVNTRGEKVFSEVTSIFYMDENLTSVEWDSLDFSPAKDFQIIFAGCKSIEKPNMYPLRNAVPTNFDRLFLNCESLTEVLNMDDIDTSALKYTSSMFKGCKALTYPIIIGDAPELISVSEMYSDCEALSVTGIGRLFSGSSYPKLTNISKLFYGCIGLTEMTMEGFDTSSVTTMSGLFSCCSNLESITGITDTASVTDMSDMFYVCNSLPSIDLSNFDTSSVTNMKRMFCSCSALDSVDVSGFNTSLVTNMEKMFQRTGLSVIDISGFDMSSVTKATDMFATYGYKINAIKTPFNVPSGIQVSAKAGTNTVTMYEAKDTVLVDETKAYEYQISSAVPEQTWLYSPYTVNFKEKTDTLFTEMVIVGADASGLHEGTWYTEMACETEADLTNIQRSNEYSQYMNVYRKVVEPDTTWQEDWNKVAGRKYELDNENKTISIFAYQGTNTAVTIPAYAVIDGVRYSTVIKGAQPFEKVQNTLSSVTIEDGVVSLTAYSMFYRCKSLINVDLSGCEFRGITSTESMFDNCSSLTSINLGENFDTSNVKTMRSMFMLCGSLTSLSLGENFDTSNVVNMQQMFAHCSSLTSLSLGNKFDTSKATNMSYMFYGLSKLPALDLGDKFDTSGVTNMQNMFGNCSVFTSIDLGDKFDTSNVTDMSYMFSGCNKITSINLGGKFNTEKVTNMENLFGYLNVCNSITLGDKFDTSNVTNMSKMFYQCKAITGLNLGGKFNTSKVTTMSGMFYNCNKLRTVDVSRFDTSNVTSMAQMFEQCTTLNSINISGFDVSKVTNMSNMFYSCSKLSTLRFNNWSNGVVRDVSGMFYKCSLLTELDLSWLDMSNINVTGDGAAAIQKYRNMITSCTNLKKLKTPKKNINSDNAAAIISTAMYELSTDGIELTGEGYKTLNNNTPTETWLYKPYVVSFISVSNNSIAFENKLPYGGNASSIHMGTWFTTDQLTTPAGLNSITADKTVYGMPSFAIRYEANNESGDYFIQTCASNSVVTIQTADYTNADGAFVVGWNTQVDGNGDGYALGDEVTFDLVDEVLTLYAVYGTELPFKGSFVVAVPAMIQMQYNNGTGYLYSESDISVSGTFKPNDFVQIDVEVPDLKDSNDNDAIDVEYSLSKQIWRDDNLDTNGTLIIQSKEDVSELAGSYTGGAKVIISSGNSL